LVREFVNIIAFLDEAGGSRLKFQMLPSCILGATKRKKFTEVRFGTEALEPCDLIEKPRNVGVIVWIPREDYERAMALAMASQGA
jgi:hypothetical protein